MFFIFSPAISKDHLVGPLSCETGKLRNSSVGGCTKCGVGMVHPSHHSRMLRVLARNVKNFVPLLYRPGRQKVQGHETLRFGNASCLFRKVPKSKHWLNPSARPPDRRNCWCPHCSFASRDDFHVAHWIVAQFSCHYHHASCHCPSRWLRPVCVCLLPFCT